MEMEWKIETNKRRKIEEWSLKWESLSLVGRALPKSCHCYTHTHRFFFHFPFRGYRTSCGKWYMMATTLSFANMFVLATKPFQVFLDSVVLVGFTVRFRVSFFFYFVLFVIMQKHFCRVAVSFVYVQLFSFYQLTIRYTLRNKRQVIFYPLFAV